MAKPKQQFMDIGNIHSEIKTDLDTIVSNLGVTRSKFLQQVFDDLIKNTSETKKNPEFNGDKIPCVRMYSFDNDKREILTTMADNAGLDLIPFLRCHLYKVVKNYPEKYKRPRPDF